MAEVYTSPFTVTLASAYTAGSGTLAVSAAAPAAIQSGTFRVRLGNASNTVLKVTGGASTTTWTVAAEFSDASASSGATVYGCEFSPGALTSLLPLYAPPYVSINGSKYVAASGFLATLPSSSPTWVNSATPPIFTVGANGDVMAGGSGGPFFAISDVTASVEAEFSTVSNTVSSPLAGIFIYDSTNHFIYFFANVTNNSDRCISLAKYNWTGSGAATYSADLAGSGIPYAGPEPMHLKLVVSGGTLSAQISLNGGQSFWTWITATGIGTITKGGYGTNNSGVIGMKSIVLV